MPSMTRLVAKAIRNHLVSTMLDSENETVFSNALARLDINEYEDLASMLPDDIETLDIERTSATEGQPSTFAPMTRGSKRKVLLLVKWMTIKKQEKPEAVSEEEWWNALTVEDFNEFRANIDPFSSNPGQPNPNVVNIGNATSVSAETSNKIELDSFKRGIKRDAAIYPTLRDETKWDNWNRCVQAQARSHEVSEVLNPDYVPLTDLERALFDKKQVFMYSVLNRVLLTDMGKTIVRKYEHSYDAQKVYTELNEYIKKSTAANISIENTIEYLTTIKLDSRWTGTTLGFILHWRDRMRQLEDMTPADEHYKDATKKRMLESAVRGINELRQVKLQDEHNVATGGATLSYLSYVDLLVSAATRRDAILKVPAQRSKRMINKSDAYYVFDEADYFDVGYVDDGESYVGQDFESNEADLILAANIAQTFPPDIWNQMPQVVRDHIILDRKNNRPSNSKFNKPSAYSKPPYPSTRKTNVHFASEVEDDEFHECTTANNEYVETANSNNNDNNNELVQVNKNEQGRLHPGDIRKVLTPPSKFARKPVPSSDRKNDKNSDYIVLNGKTYYSANTITLTYSSFNQHVLPRLGALVDRGANGGIAGDDVVLLELTHRTCDVSGIDNHTMKGLPIATCAGLVNTNYGPIIIILHQYAYSGKGHTIHSSAQIEHFGNLVDDRSAKVRGKQQIVTLDDFVLPLHIRNGLPYLDMSKPTTHELDTLTHVVLTSDVDWNPALLDNEFDLEELGSQIDVNRSVLCRTCNYSSNKTNITSKYELMSYNTSFSDYVDTIVTDLAVSKHSVKPTPKDFERLRPNFGYAPVDIVKKTFECTTQWARMVERYPFRKHFKSRFPALNVIRRSEAVATDTVFSDTPAIDNGCYIAQIFVGCKTFVTDVYPMKQEANFSIALQENIRKRGAMDKLVSDRAQVEISDKVKDLLRHYNIDDSQSEPYHEHQNPAERRYQTLKKYTNIILDQTGAPPNTWLLCLKYVCYVLNRTYVESLNTVPLQALTGQTQDISVLLPFRFWEPVYFATAEALSYNTSVSFPSNSAEAKGRFVGFGENVGDALTFLVLSDKTQRALYRSSVRSANDGPPNLRLEPLEGESADLASNNDIVKSLPSTEVGSSSTQSEGTNTSIDDNSFYTSLPIPSVTNVADDDNDIDPDDKQANIKATNDVLDHIEQQHDDTDPEDKLWRFTSIVSHEGPLTSKSPAYKGSRYNVLVVWEDGTQTYEPLDVVAKDDPVTCAIYARDNDLLDLPGWKRLKLVARNEHRIKRFINVSKSSFKFDPRPKHKFGFQIPRNVKDALDIDRKLRQTKWQDAMSSEINQIQEYKTFKNLGKGAPIPEGYKKIRVHFVFDVKHDGRHKARLVADGHLTSVLDDSVYSSVVSLRDLRLVVFAGEKNGLTTWSADVGNAYLESYTKEKVCVIAGPEFGELEGCLLVIVKALYGLRSSGLRWHERFADTLRDLGFKPCKTSSDVWMRNASDVYEYIAVYVDDLAIVAKDPKLITDLLVNKYKYKLKGVGPIDYHLGGNFARDSDGTLSYGPKKYIDKLISSYTKMFDSYPTERTSPLVRGDHPELDDSPELDQEGIKQYQSMMGALQWCVSLGRFDILAAVMTLSRFRIAPRIGHLDRIKRVYGYLKKFKNGAIRFRTGKPDYSKLEPGSYDWSSSVYNLDENDEEKVPSDVPIPLGEPVITTTYVDANLMHCLTTGRSATGILHLVNGTPIDWYSKRQATVQSATYGSEFVAARIATDQVIDLKQTLEYMGIPVERAVMFGDNQSVVTSATVPQSKLNKRHVALSYHRTREAIATKQLEFYHIHGDINPADMLSKFAGYPQFWPILRSLLFWGVNVDTRPDDGEDEGDTKNQGSKPTFKMVGSDTTT